MMELIGLIPAAGRATRMAPLPCSKELLPIGFRVGSGPEGARPKVATHYLLDHFARAGVTRTYIVLRNGKWDIPSYFGGNFEGMDLGYLLMRRPFGVPFTLDDAYPFLQRSMVVFGFPDILFKPMNTFSTLLAARERSGADVEVAVFRSRRPDKDDVLELDARGRITRFEPKRADTGLTLTWIVAVWTPAFTEFMHEFIAQEWPAVHAQDGKWRGRELYMSDVIWAAIGGGLKVETVTFEDGDYLDIGTPEDLHLALRKLMAASAIADAGAFDNATDTLMLYPAGRAP